MSIGQGLRWRQIGSGARPVMALHCSLAHGGAWAGVAADLEGVRISAPDLPGHGMSADWDGQGDYHSQTTVAVAALIAEIGVGGPIDVIGHSFGGTVALRLALERPDLLRSLVLIEPVLFAAARDAAPQVYDDYLAAHRPFQAALAAGNKAEATALFHAVWGQGALDEMPPRHRDYIVARIGLVAALDATLAEDRAGLLAPQRLEGLSLPVLLLEGGASPPVIGAIQSELARRLPMARQQVIAGAAHMLPVTHPAPVAAAIAAHLALA